MNTFIKLLAALVVLCGLGALHYAAGLLFYLGDGEPAARACCYLVILWSAFIFWVAWLELRQSKRAWDRRWDVLERKGGLR